MSSRQLVPLGVAVFAGFALALGGPLSANAHVTIDPQSAEPGSYTIVTARVPNESATATTNRIEITLPSDTPFQSVRYVPVAGWTTELVTTEFDSPVTVGDREITRAVTSVIWTADAGAEVADGELQLFPLSVGPVPDTGRIVMPVTQTYTDGSTVEWSETAADAEHPAPVLYIDDAPEGDHHDDGDGDSAAASAHGEPATEALDSDDSDADAAARALGVTGIILGAAGVVFGIMSRRRPRI